MIERFPIYNTFDLSPSLSPPSLFPLAPPLSPHTEWCSIVLSICYIKFPELARLYALQGESGRTVSPCTLIFELFSVGCQFVCFFSTWQLVQLTGNFKFVAGETMYNVTIKVIVINWDYSLAATINLFVQNHATMLSRPAFEVSGCCKHAMGAVQW